MSWLGLVYFVLLLDTEMIIINSSKFHPEALTQCEDDSKMYHPSLYGINISGPRRVLLGDASNQKLGDVQGRIVHSPNFSCRISFHESPS